MLLCGGCDILKFNQDNSCYARDRYIKINQQRAEVAKRSKAAASRAALAGVRGFKSLPPHTFPCFDLINGKSFLGFDQSLIIASMSAPPLTAFIATLLALSGGNALLFASFAVI